MGNRAPLRVLKGFGRYLNYNKILRFRQYPVTNGDNKNGKIGRSSN